MAEWTRDSVLNALTTRIDDGYTFTTTSRTFKTWDQTPSAEQPACFVTYMGEQHQNQPAKATVYTLQVTLTIYCHPDVLVTTLDALNDKLKLQATEMGYQNTTLGGLVDTVNITNIEVDEGVSIEHQAGALASLEILIAD